MARRFGSAMTSKTDSTIFIYPDLHIPVKEYNEGNQVVILFGTHGGRRAAGEVSRTSKTSGARTRMAGGADRAVAGRGRELRRHERGCGGASLHCVASLREGERTVAKAILDWTQCPAVESIPGKVSGAWVFRGTRMPVQTVFENLEAGMSVDEITEVFDVTPEEVKAVLHFASESLAKAPSFG